MSLKNLGLNYVVNFKEIYMENLLSKEEMEAVINGDHGNVLQYSEYIKTRAAKKFLFELISLILKPLNYLITTIIP